MIGETGVKLDKNGYSPSIMQQEDVCIFCNTTLYLQRHEIFHGYANRHKSKEFGLWVHVCPTCHFKIHHTDGELDLTLKKIGQETAMEYYAWDTDEFRRKFGRNYL